MQHLRKNIQGSKEPPSTQILQDKSHKEREYLQKLIIQMEIKQIAESITRVTHAKKIFKSKSQDQEDARTTRGRSKPASPAPVK